MTKALLIATALACTLTMAACSENGQPQTADGSIQLPGARPAADLGLNAPPDEWAAPPPIRPSVQTASATTR
jgi:hypothetical protein